MSFDESNEPIDVFSRLQNHQARDVIEGRRKFQWRFTTLNKDYQDLLRLNSLSAVPASEMSEQLQKQDYVFEVERRLHHYLSGLYTMLEVHQTIQDGIGQEYEDQLSDIENNFRGRESARTLLGLRHYVQHENVLPLQPYYSSINQETSLVVLLGDLEMQEDYQDGFDAHYGHLRSPYCEPLNLIVKNWPHVKELFEDTMEVIQEQAEPELTEFQQLLDYVDNLNEEIHQELLDGGDFSGDFSFFSDIEE